MSANCFKQWQKSIPVIWAHETLQLDGNQDLWWKFVPAKSE